MTEEAKDCRTKRIQGDGSRVSKERKESVGGGEERQGRRMREGHRRMEHRDISNSSPEKGGDTVKNSSGELPPVTAALMKWNRGANNKEHLPDLTCHSPAPQLQLRVQYSTIPKSWKLSHYSVA